MPGRDFVDHCVELFAGAGRPRARRMFGGHGLYVDDLFVAIVVADRLYLKADADTRAQFERAGCAPFVYAARGRSVSLGYWSAPDVALDSAQAMRPWLQRAVDAALRARATTGKAAGRPRRRVGQR